MNEVHMQKHVGDKGPWTSGKHIKIGRNGQVVQEIIKQAIGI